MRALAALAERPFDALVVGGGVLGAAVAWDAARRGLRVALVEARDFGAGTSAATTRLAHGGLRYLEHYDFPQVREGLAERAWLLRAAPHLVEPLPFLFPVGPGARALGVKLRLGLALYDRLAPGDLPRHRMLGAAAALRAEPRLRPGAVARAAQFHDAQVRSPERLVLEYALGAEAAGAVVANHAAVTSLAREAPGWRATVHDTIGDARVEVRARAVLNCAGPWATRLAGLAGVGRALTRNTRGSHVAFPNVLRQALILRARDGRTFFALPWNEVALVGTTDLDEARDPAEVAATPDEVRYLLEEAGRFLDLDDAPPAYTTAGVRAMVREEGGAPGAVPRRHVVLDHARDGAPGLLTVAGGKLTTARAAAEDAVDALCKLLGTPRPRPGPPAALPYAPDGPVPATALAAAGLGPDLARGLRLFGREAPGVLGGGAVCPRHATGDMLRHVVAREHAATLADVMLRRTLAGHAPDLGAHCAPAVARALGGPLGWDRAAEEAQLRAYERAVAQRRSGL